MAKNRTSFSDDIIKDFTFGKSSITDNENLGDFPSIENKVENESKTILEAEFDKFIPYADSKLRLELLEGEQRERLKESIIKNGIMQPVIVMKENDRLVILAGHNRVDIAKELGIKVPYIIRENITKDEADLIVIDTNILNRQLSDYKPSQLSYILKVKADAERMKDNEDDSKATVKEIGRHYKLSRTQIFLYIRLNNLIDDFMIMLDKKKLSLDSAYNLTFIKPDIQKMIYNFVSIDKIKINKNISKEIKSKFESLEEYSEDLVNSIMSQIVSSATELSQTNVRHSSVAELSYFREYIPNSVNDESMEEYIINALKAYESSKAGIN